MSLKIKTLLLAAQRGQFVSLNPEEHPCGFAQVLARRGRLYLLYPDGKIGRLQMNFHHRWEVECILFPLRSYKPTKDQLDALGGLLPSTRMVFDEEYGEKELPSHLPPEQIHLTDEERFRNPHGVWEEAVKHHLEKADSLS